ncbi:hypothetical protein INR49_004774 [Caranx melampygus]|nr:hypothetical protein INR49_004774 [Caranx melampygus]
MPVFHDSGCCDALWMLISSLRLTYINLFSTVGLGRPLGLFDPVPLLHMTKGRPAAKLCIIGWIELLIRSTDTSTRDLSGNNICFIINLCEDDEEEVHSGPQCTTSSPVETLDQVEASCSCTVTTSCSCKDTDLNNEPVARWLQVRGQRREMCPELRGAAGPDGVKISLSHVRLAASSSGLL